MNDERDCRSATEGIERVMDESRKTAFIAADRAMVTAYWNIGRRIVEEEQRTGCGENIISEISCALTREFGSCCSRRNLHYFRQFYRYFSEEEILDPHLQNLTWPHFRSLLRVPDENARVRYMHEAAEANWSAGTLEYNIERQYYNHLRKTPEKDAAETKKKEEQPSEFINSPVVAEFLGFCSRDADSDLQSALITHLCSFFLRMDRGYALVARQ